ncbi:MAG TPA: type II toxin-antitoxin system RelE/ParE family toxin [Xanthobacteraceae bacterium]|nr:type II toxin-antitoxin system RelE/ParE family toxin [Xanthobacteraceae bacterium]
MKVRYRELALSDLDRIFSYLEERNPAAARNVIVAIHAAIADVAENPLSARRTSDPTVRVKVVSRYGYKIFYSVEADAIEILHVRHGARRPWPAEEGK